MSFVKSKFGQMAQNITAGPNYGGGGQSPANSFLSASQFGSAFNGYSFFNGGQYQTGWTISGSLTSNGTPNSSSYPVQYLKIMSGAIGTTAAVDALVDFPTASFATQTLVGGYAVSNSYASNLFTMNFSGTNPSTRSGVATWFMLQLSFSYSPDVPTPRGAQCIWGTVGLPGSGADLILNETNIVSGKNYQLPKIVLPLYNSLFEF